ncbi:MAG: thiosulfate oxidation carrier complex protein SoxZ [Gemmatimonadales bacterium]
MREIGKAKILVPDRITKGDLIRVTSIVQHPMDTGFFRDANANLIPPYFIQDVTVTYGDTEVARFEWTSGISRDPMVAFNLRADREATLALTWKDNKGGVFQSSVSIAFSAT